MAGDMYTYLDTVSPDVDETLSVSPQDVITEEGSRSQTINTGDDGSEERIALHDSTIFHVSLKWNVLNSADANTIFDFWHDSTKGDGMINSFKWSHPVDDHTYVARFDSDCAREINLASLYGFATIRLKILGKV